MNIKESQNPDFKPAGVADLDLYQKREKIYTRKIEGFYQRIRLYTGWPLLIGYFGLPWLEWGSRQAVLFDLPARQFHVFGITFWPQNFPLLAGVLIIAAFALFAITSWFGRVWCGYTCPQTVWTAIFMWAEQFCEGSRNQRIKRDKAPWTAEKFFRKLAKHIIWLGFAYLTGLAFVGYFVPIKELFIDLVIFQADYWAGWWVLFFTAATYINAGWMREQVCMYMCPYARFQSVMFDHDTLIVSYDPKRGESRGARKKSADPKELGLGDCVDCQVCVQVCPTGIDIRDGLQYECINCALCVDGCDSVMEQMGYDKGLISYTTENELAGIPTKMLRFRPVAYAVLTVLVSIGVAWGLFARIPLELDVIRDRDRLYREVAGGMIENSYTLKIFNMDQQDHSYRVSVEGLDGAVIKGLKVVNLSAGEVAELPLRVQMDPALLPLINTKILYRVQSIDDEGLKADSESRFIRAGAIR
jgi:cytochrome c oxidase accessory protein FixG